MLEAQMTTGKYSAMAEVLLYHAQKADRAPEVVVYPDDRRVRAALKYAIENHWPFVIHIEFASLSGNTKKRFMKDMETLFETHPGQPFVLAHMGQLGPDECRSLIEKHGNVYFHTGWSNPAAIRISDQPWINLFEGYRLASEWQDLFTQYPGRIIFALDNVFNEHWSNLYLEQMAYWKRALAELPAETAHLVARGNAERLWRILQ